MTAVERAAEVLVVHQRMDSRSCLCGWDHLGLSHSRHQAEALAAAGLLADDANPPGRLRSDGPSQGHPDATNASPGAVSAGVVTRGA